MPKGNWCEFNKPTVSNSILNDSLGLNFQKRKLQISKQKSGRNGKIVTLINGLENNQHEAKKILKFASGTLTQHL